DHEEDGSADALADIVGGQGEQQHEDHDDEDAERAELAVEIGSGAFLDRSADLLHLGGALAGGQYLPEQDEADGQGGERDHRDHTDDDAVARGELEARRDTGGQSHPSSWFKGTLRPGNVTAPLASAAAPKPDAKVRRGRVQCKWAVGVVVRGTSVTSQITMRGRTSRDREPALTAGGRRCRWGVRTSVR